MPSAASGWRTWTGHRAPTAAKRIPCAAPPRTVRSGRGRSVRQTTQSRYTTPYLALTTKKVLCPWSLPDRLCLTTPSCNCWIRSPSGPFNAGSIAVTATHTPLTVLYWQTASQLNCLPHSYARDPPARSGVRQLGQACQALVSRVALTSVGSKMKGGRSLCAVYMCAFLHIHTYSHMYVRDRKREKASESEGVTY